MASQHIPVVLSKSGPQLAIRTQSEDWTGITDPAQRRKLQNRLHQRAWRRRRTEARKQSRLSGDRTANASASSSSPDSCLDDSSPEVDLELNISICQHSDDEVTRQIARIERHVHQSLIWAPSPALLPSIIKFNIYRALRSNNESLGFGLEWRQPDAISPFLGDHGTCRALATYPIKLRPTALQRTVAHHPWIDLLPLPEMRDNILRLGEEYDDEPLCFDIVDDMAGSGSGLIVWGDPWNPHNWEVTEEFARKWFWVLRSCFELFEATNKWRALRGEPRLFPEALWKSQVIS